MGEGDALLRKESKRVLSLSASKGRKVELIATTLTLLVKKMGYGVLAAASRIVTGTQIDLAALNEACTWADYSPMSGAADIEEEYMLLARPVIEEMVDHLPYHHEVSEEVVAALQQRLITLLLRAGHLVGEEACVQSVSYTDSKLVVHSLTISHPLPFHLQDCFVPLAKYHPMVTMDTAVLLEMEAKVSYSLVRFLSLRFACF